jgi:ATP-dependent helicase IRC3
MRLSPQTGKQDCRIIDFVDSSNRVSGIICTPTLFGLNPGEIDIEGRCLDFPLRCSSAESSYPDETTESLEERAAQTIDFDCRNDVPMPKSVTYVDHENPFSFVGQSSGAPHINSLSRNAWVGCGGDIYVLECLGKGHIRIEPVPEDESTWARYCRSHSHPHVDIVNERHFQAFFAPAMIDKVTSKALKISPFMRSRHILTAKDLSAAIRGCDTYATAKVVFGQMALGYVSPQGMPTITYFSLDFFDRHVGGRKLLRNSRPSS